MAGHHAFSLIELLVVLLLCSLLAGLGAIHLSFLDATLARTEIEKLTTVCTYLHHLAMATNSEQRISFDKDHTQYRFGNACEQLSKRIVFGTLPGVKGPPGSARAIVENAITFPHQHIIFYPSGIISSGTVYFIDKEYRVQYALSNAVSQISHLRMYRWNGKWKEYGCV